MWFEPLATPDSPRDLLINVAAGRQTQGQAGRGWIGPEWSSLTKSGTGSLVLDRGNALAGPLAIDAGSLLVTDPAAVAAASQLAVAAEAMLDVGGLPGSYQVPAGQTISGNGTIAGSVVFGRGSTLSPGLNSAAPSSQAVPGVPVPEPSGVAVVVLAIAAGVARGRRAATSVRTG